MFIIKSLLMEWSLFDSLSLSNPYFVITPGGSL